MVIEKGVHADIDELAQLYDDLNDFLDSDINHPGWIKGVYTDYTDSAFTKRYYKIRGVAK